MKVRASNFSLQKHFAVQWLFFITLTVVLIGDANASDEHRFPKSLRIEPLIFYYDPWTHALLNAKTNDILAVWQTYFQAIKGSCGGTWTLTALPEKTNGATQAVRIRFEGDITEQEWVDCGLTGIRRPFESIKETGSLYCPIENGRDVRYNSPAYDRSSIIFDHNQGRFANSLSFEGFDPVAYCEVEDKSDEPDCDCDSPQSGNPIFPSTGMKQQIEVDYQGTGLNRLSFSRTYRSDRNSWKHNHQVAGQDFAATQTSAAYSSWVGSCFKSAHDIPNLPATELSSKTCLPYMGRGEVNDIGVQRGNGRMVYFGNALSLSPAADINDRASAVTNGSAAKVGNSIYNAANDSTERYDLSGSLQSVTFRNGQVHNYTYSAGLLTSVADQFGHQLTFVYDGQNRMATMTASDGSVYSYAYDEASAITLAGNATAGNLTSVTYPGGLKRIYWYNEQDKTAGTNQPYALTGITDENGTRFATFMYNAAGKAVSTEHAGGVEKYNVNLVSPLVQTVVTDPLNTARTYNFSRILGLTKSTGQSLREKPSKSAGSNTITYDANGNVSSRTDFNSNRTDYNYDLTRNLEISRTEAAGTSIARTITTSWNPQYRLPATVTEPLRRTDYAYDASGNLLSRTVTETTTNVSRTWSYTYDSLGRALTATDPRGKVASSTFYATSPALGTNQGMLASVTNAANQITQYTSYDGSGRVLSMTDPNGVVTSMTYHPRGWLSSRTTAGERTSYAYDGVGQLVQVTMPDNSRFTYTYDGAHRLTGIQDALGNRVAYTLDAGSNRTKEETFNAQGQLAKTRSHTFDALSRVASDVGALNQTSTYQYDPQGNATVSVDPNNNGATRQYDALNRMSTTTDALAGITSFGYDALDRLTTVTDPKGLVTTYTYNGLGDLKNLASPNTGTSSYSHDAAGNIASMTDARGVTSSYIYDNLNRISNITYSDGVVLSYGYDSCTNGVGRLCSATDPSGNTSFNYDARGRVTQKSQTIGSGASSITKQVAYAYDAGGRLSGMTYPSGKGQTLSYDLQGRVTGVTYDGRTVLSQAEYFPFGPADLWTYGNGAIYERMLDRDGQIQKFTLPNIDRTLGHDSGLRITGFSDQPVANGTPTGSPSARAFGYDKLDRVTSSLGGGSNYEYGFDADGNRLGLTNAAGLTSYSYLGGSQRLQSSTGAASRTYAYDNAGNTLSNGPGSFTYDGRGRMVTSSQGGINSTYLLNALGQRVKKTLTGNANDTTYFIYDEQGKLIGEYASDGGIKSEHIWLNDIPVAVSK